jgi:aminoglycoside phosphotransferase family enzyme
MNSVFSVPSAVLAADASSVSLAEKVVALKSPASYPHEPDAVESIETHFAWVFLAGGYAYKLKKPRCSDWSDLRLLEARRLNCEDEVRLNRRLAPGVYLGVLPLVRGLDGRLTVGGEGTVVDWLVQMQRLPSASMLDQAIASGTASPASLGAVGVFLAEFYRTQPRVAFDANAYVERMAEQIRCDREALFARELQLDEHHVQNALAATWCAAAAIEDELGRRASEARIVEAHGDLRPEHICLIDPPCIIDCLEFSRDLRTMDPAEELAYLWIECERAGGGQAAAYVLEAYCRGSRDPVTERLLDFYRSRRAMVRAKIVAWHLCDPAVMNLAPWRQLAEEYLSISRRYAIRVAATQPGGL